MKYHIICHGFIKQHKKVWTMIIMLRRLSNYTLKKDTPKIEVTMEPEDESYYTPEERATYQKIKGCISKTLQNSLLTYA